MIFDRSWHNRAGVERVMGFCTEAESKRFLSDPGGISSDAERILEPLAPLLMDLFKMGEADRPARGAQGGRGRFTAEGRETSPSFHRQGLGGSRQPYQ